MKTLTKITSLLLLTVALSFAAVPYPVEVAKSHTATGAAGCTVSGVTAATPAVITCAAAHNLADGDPIQITGVGGTTTVNTVGYAKVTGYSTTTFALYSDQGLASAVTGTGSYTSGGYVSEAFVVSSLTGDFTLRFRLDSLTAAKTFLVSVQESADGFNSDIRTLWVGSFIGGSAASPGGVVQTVRAYQIPSNRFGTASVAVRLYVQAIGSSATAVTSLFVEY